MTVRFPRRRPLSGVMTLVPDALDMTVQHIDDRTAIVVVAGDVDLHTAVSLRAYVVALLNRDVRHLVLDLAGVEYVDSSGLSTLVVLLHAAREHGGSLRVAEVPERLMRMLTMTGISEVLPVHRTVTDAVAAAGTADGSANAAGDAGGTPG
ncbi:hypothetical protein SUDANB108_00221 [Streptomyces sp. enrichment culture]